MSVRWPQTWGYRPVNMLHRLGLHQGIWAKQLLKDTPSAARLSIFGVRARVSPEPNTASALNVSGMKSRKLGRFVIVYRTAAIAVQRGRESGIPSSYDPCSFEVAISLEIDGSFDIAGSLP